MGSSNASTKSCKSLNVSGLSGLLSNDPTGPKRLDIFHSFAQITCSPIIDIPTLLDIPVPSIICILPVKHAQPSSGTGVGVTTITLASGEG